MSEQAPTSLLRAFGVLIDTETGNSTTLTYPASPLSTNHLDAFSNLRRVYVS